MRTLKFLLRKEFSQIFRDPAILRIIFIMPVVQLIVLPFAADYEVKHINLSVVNQDPSPTANILIEKMAASGYFNITHHTTHYGQALQAIEDREADIVLNIPPDFEKNLLRESVSTVLIAANAIDGIKAGLGVSYANQIIQDFNQEIRAQLLPPMKIPARATIRVQSANWYNPDINYQLFMVPGILVVLVTMVGSFLTALNIVKEKENGTIEQINVSPVKKHQFLLGKLIPFWVLGMIILALGLGISWLIHGILPAGNYLDIFLFAGLYLVAVLGIGLLVSTFADTQQQATFIAFFILMVFILLSGLYTPIDSMPAWAKIVSWFNPVTHFVEVIRAIVIKGSHLSDLLPQTATIALFALIYNTLAVLNYRKTG
jgi:ABC-2 type transport system permease protein